MIGLLIVVLLLCFLVIARHLRRNYGQVNWERSQLKLSHQKLYQRQIANSYKLDKEQQSLNLFPRWKSVECQQ